MSQTAPSPVPTGQLFQEVARSGILLLGLVGAAVLFALVHAWVIAVIVAIVAVVAMFSGAVVHPAQLLTARRPAAATKATAQPVYRHKQVWLKLEAPGAPPMAVEMRSRKLAHTLGGHPFPVEVLGTYATGERVVIQANKLTIWPVAKMGPVPPNVDTVDHLQKSSIRGDKQPPDRPFG
jgi:hypothetical protein